MLKRSLILGALSGVLLNPAIVSAKGGFFSKDNSRDKQSEARDNLKEKQGELKDNFKEKQGELKENFKEKQSDIKENLNEVGITAAIKAKFLSDPAISSLKISVTTDKGGVVTLTGSVASNMEYDRAVMLAYSVSDDVSWVNATNLKVEKSDHPLKDTYITAKIKGSLLRNAIFKTDDTKLWGVSVETNDGKVYISGSVDNEQQKDNIVRLARETKDVSDVDASALEIDNSNR